MQIVELIHAERGAKKVSCTQALQTHCGLGLVAAKEVTDAMLDRKYPTVSMQSPESARALVVELAALGVVARFAEGPAYKPQERLASALASVQSILAPEVLRTCESLSAHGEWELALSHCLAHLPMQVNEGSPAILNELGQLAIEFGVIQKGPQ